MSRRTLESKIEHIDEVMRSDGLGILQYIEQLSWFLFLKVFEDVEEEFELEAELEERKYSSIIDRKYRWSSWAREEEKAEDIKRFVEDELLTYLRGLHGRREEEMISSIFSEVRQNMRSPYNLKDVILELDDVDFSSPEDSHALSRLYESQLMMMGREGGVAGEYYTPRPIVRLMVKIVDPRVRETVFDPLCGTCGFLVESFNWMKGEKKLTSNEHELLQERAFYGQELRGLPYLIGMMNCILHGLLKPNIIRKDTFEEDVTATPKRRFDAILTNPPFGGNISENLMENLPVEAGNTELGALQYCMRKLNEGGRCGIVLPEGVLFRGGAYKRVKEELLRDFNLHTIISLPQGIFANIAPKGGQGPKANLVFFDKDGSTEEIWYYELVGNYTKANPVKDEDLNDCYEKWKDREISENSWLETIGKIEERDYDLSARNPSRVEEITYADPGELIEDAIEREKEIFGILKELRNSLSEERGRAE